MPRQEIADPEDFGRKLSEAVVELRICRCKTGCKNMLCKCRENNLRLAFAMVVVTQKTIMMILQITMEQLMIKVLLMMNTIYVNYVS